MNTTHALPQETDYGITIDAGLHPQQPQKILVRGKLRVSYGKNGVPDEGTAVLKHVVLVVSRTLNYQSLTPFKDVIVFSDDLRDEGNGCSASFNINVMDHIRFEGAGDYYILCSIGTYTSNVVKVVVT